MQRSITVKKIIMLNDYSFLSLILSSSSHPPPHPTPLLRLGERKKKPQPCRTKGKVSARPTNTRQLSSVHELSAMPFNQAPLPPSSLFPCRVPPPLPHLHLSLFLPPKNRSAHKEKRTALCWKASIPSAAATLHSFSWGNLGRQRLTIVLGCDVIFSPPPCGCDYFTFTDNIIAGLRLDAFTLHDASPEPCSIWELFEAQRSRKTVSLSRLEHWIFDGSFECRVVICKEDEKRRKKRRLVVSQCLLFLFRGRREAKKLLVRMVLSFLSCIKTFVWSRRFTAVYKRHGRQIEEVIQCNLSICRRISEICTFCAGWPNGCRRKWNGPVRWPSAKQTRVLWEKKHRRASVAKQNRAHLERRRLLAAL